MFESSRRRWCILKRFFLLQSRSDLFSSLKCCLLIFLRWWWWCRFRLYLNGGGSWLLLLLSLSILTLFTFVVFFLFLCGAFSSFCDLFLEFVLECVFSFLFCFFGWFFIFFWALFLIDVDTELLYHLLLHLIPNRKLELIMLRFHISFNLSRLFLLLLSVQSEDSMDFLLDFGIWTINLQQQIQISQGIWVLLLRLVNFFPAVQGFHITTV